MGASGMDADQAGEWLTISAAARRLGVSRRAIQKRIERDTLRWRPDGNKGRLVLVAHCDDHSDGHGEAHSDLHGDGHSDLSQRLAEVERELAVAKAVAT